MASAGSKRSGLARSLKGLSDDESFESAAAAPSAAAPSPSLRDRLADYFRAGQNASDRELAALFGASVGSISVYRCQLKKLGIGVASPPGSRTAMAAKRGQRAAAAKAGGPSKRGGAPSARGKAAKSRGAAGAAASSAAQAGSGALSLAEIDQVLIQNLETELGLIEGRYPELARPVANIQQTVRLLLKLHRQ
jgi:hypothetical protein